MSRPSVNPTRRPRRHRLATQLADRRQLWAWDRVSPPPPLRKRQNLAALARRYGLRRFVETGTLHGETSNYMARRLDAVWTIEVDRALYSAANDRFVGTNVRVMLGDSGDLLPEVLEELDGSALFWLDGHWSGDDTGRGAKDTPILDELRMIVADDRFHVVVVDDARLFTGEGDYPTIDEVEAIVAPHGVTVREDAIEIVLSRNVNGPSESPSVGRRLRRRVMARVPRLRRVLVRSWTVFGNLLRPLVDGGLLASVRRYPGFVGDARRYGRLGGRVNVGDIRPMLHERTATHELDSHYFHQAVWAARHIAASGVSLHHDVASQALFVGMLTAIVDVEFIDLRPLPVDVKGLRQTAGTVLELPMPAGSVHSLSCLHVAEHVGLGRYGDPLDPLGTQRAAAELARVLAPGGSLYFSVPIGCRREEFNAHRVFAIDDIIAMFPTLELVELAMVRDDGTLAERVSLAGWDGQRYACGLFLFRSP